jgi:lipid-binding SYLF domain-containing protein
MQDMSEFVVVLNSEEAVKAFSNKGNMTIGGNLSASAGPIGTGGSVNSALVNPSPMFSEFSALVLLKDDARIATNMLSISPPLAYSKSKGLYAGVSLEGTALIERSETNAAFYGAKIPAKDLLA